MWRIPDATFFALGYDEYGNNSALLAEIDRAVIERGGVVRVSGDGTCRKCNMPYRLHPSVQGALWVTRGCDGLVKL